MQWIMLIPVLTFMAFVVGRRIKLGSGTQSVVEDIRDDAPTAVYSVWVRSSGALRAKIGGLGGVTARLVVGSRYIRIVRRDSFGEFGHYLPTAETKIELVDGRRYPLIPKTKCIRISSDSGETPAEIYVYSRNQLSAVWNSLVSSGAHINQ
jgi:hypothetical protein